MAAEEKQSYSDPARGAIVYMEGGMTLGVRETADEIDTLIKTVDTELDYITVNALRSVGETPESGPWVYDELRLSLMRVLAYG